MTTCPNEKDGTDAEAERRYKELVEEAIPLAKDIRCQQFLCYWKLGKLVAEAEVDIRDRSTLRKVAKALRQDPLVIKAACEMHRRFPDEEAIEWAVEHKVTLGLMSGYLRGVKLRDIPREVLRRLEATDEDVEPMDLVPPPRRRTTSENDDDLDNKETERDDR